MAWKWLGRVSPHKEVQEALESSAKRAEKAARAKRDFNRKLQPLREVLEHNHFEQSVLAVMRGKEDK